jgi:prephenate dehydrogenase
MGTVGIIGLGLIGGSFGLALKRAKLADTTVIGHDRDNRRAERARDAGAIDRIAASQTDLAREADLVVLATPILPMRRILEEIASHLKRGAVVTDTASTKKSVMTWARDSLPDHVHFIGGHPMAGKEKSGPEAAEETLFDNRPYVVIPSVNASEASVNAIFGLAELLGGRPMFMEAEEHDAYAAAISHLPLVASVALFSMAHGSQAWPELANLAGPGFHDLTRLASGRPEMAHDISLTNRDNITHWIDRYIDELLRLRELVDRRGDEDENLFRTFVETQLARDAFVANPPVRQIPGMAVDMPTPNDSLVALLAGGYAAERMREVTENMESDIRDRQQERLRHRSD